MLLEKLARLAAQLDRREMYAQADALTDVMLRIASDELFEEDTDPDPEPGSPLYVPNHEVQPYHKMPEVYTGSDEFLGHMEKADPKMLERWQHHLNEARYDTRGNPVPLDKLYLSPQYYGDRTIHMPRGWSKTKQNGSAPTPENLPGEWGLDNFVFNPNDSKNMEDNVWGTFDKLTGGGKKRNYLHLDNYGGFKPDPAKGHDKPSVYRSEMVYDPHFNEKLFPDYAAYQRGEGPRPKGMPLLESKRYQGIGRGDLERLRQIDPRLYEKVMSNPAFAEQMAQAARGNMSPRNMPFFGRRPRGTDPETGQPQRNFYLRPQEIRRRLEEGGEG